MLDEHLMMRCSNWHKKRTAKEKHRLARLSFAAIRLLPRGESGPKNCLTNSAHAELQAIQAACRVLSTQDLSGLAIYSNVEPCVLCAYVIRRAGLARVVFGVPAGQAGGFTSQYALLSDVSLRGWPPPPEIEQGVLLDSCRTVMSAFLSRFSKS